MTFLLLFILDVRFFRFLFASLSIVGNLENAGMSRVLLDTGGNV